MKEARALHSRPNGGPQRPTPSDSRRKRSFDFLLATFALLLLAPLLILISVAVGLETGGPILYRQERTGYRGRVFTIFKFRTMTVTENGAEAQQATRADARVTKVGGLLRRLSFDELPQLFNIVRGDMSLIGPRPHAIGHDRKFAGQVAGYTERFNTRPGLTGLAQVSGYRGEIRGYGCIAARVAADCEYISTWTFGLDIQILLRTIPLIFRDPRAY